MNHKIINLLGLAQRAGKLTSGDFIVEKSIKKRDAKLVFLAIDTSINNEKKFKELTTACGVPVIQVLTKEQLGQAIGKEMRVVVAVEDDGFARAMQRELTIED